MGQGNSLKSYSDYTDIFSAKPEGQAFKYGARCQLRMIVLERGVKMSA